MKIYCLFLLAMFFYGSFVSGMELSPQASWNNFSDKVIMHIAVSLEDKRAFFCVNNRLSEFVKISLMEAVNKRNYVIAEFLLKKGASVNAKDTFGTTALVRSIETDQYDMMKLLLNYKADPDTVNVSGDVPLCKVVRQNNCPAVTLLLDKGALVDVKNFAGWTPLMLSVRHNNISVASKGMDKNWEKTGNTFVSFIIAELLLSVGADPNLADYNGDTALHSAIFFNNILMIDLLLHYGANPYIKNLKHKNAYSLTYNHDILQRLDKFRNVKR